MAAPNSWIIYPDVPPAEEDPYARINVMIDIFNFDISSSGKADRGFYHEIYTAIKLASDRKITHGSQISRPLTAAEKLVQKGNSQMILVPLEYNNYRELDMVYEENGTIYVVEAKNKSKAEHRQLKDNVLLALRLRGGVVYALPGNDSQEKALKKAYKAIPEAQYLPPLVVIQIPYKVAEVYSSGRIEELLPLPTLEEIEDWRDWIVESEFDPYTHEMPSRQWGLYSPYPDRPPVKPLLPQDSSTQELASSQQYPPQQSPHHVSECGYHPQDSLYQEPRDPCPYDQHSLPHGQMYASSPPLGYDQSTQHFPRSPPLWNSIHPPLREHYAPQDRRSS
ncbi:MAG: hypothetical protein M1836_007390 [Candelina mexicana]|nr:MAG: hypothetical protein M1836_007390 [Candelina mexicana]